MKKKGIMSDATADDFFNFMKERHAIYIRRNRGDPWPWTNDPILKEYKFTNVYRELDMGTVYCREQIRKPYAGHQELFFNIAMYRLCNWIPTYENIGFISNFDANYVNGVLRKMRQRGEQIFTGAHMITGTLGGDKIHQIVDICLTQLWQNRDELTPVPGDTLEMAFNRLCKHNPGYGPFIAYEVITDLRWTRYLCDATDIYTWANPGPGAKRGLHRILGMPVNEGRISNDEYIAHMRDLLHMSERLPKWMPKLEMRDIEHSLCEFDKYDRARLGHGKPRNRFVPPHLR